VRVTTAFKRLLALDAVNVTAVEFGPSMIVVSVALRRRRLECPHCDYSTRWRYDTRPVPSRWRTSNGGSRARRSMMGLVTDHATVRRWVAGYELAWRTTRTDGLAALFTADATYLHSPYEQPVVGLHAIRQMWDEDRDGADEIFTLATEVLAIEGDTAVVRAEVRYGDPIRQEYRDVWILRLTDDGRCAWFEEWPYWPGRPYSARDDAPIV
jgi:ketosteroid isomerase-like protein